MDAQAAATLIAAASDIALVLSRHGVIENIAVNLSDLPAANYSSWIGRPLVEVVTPDSRDKVKTLIDDASHQATARWRHVNHPVAQGADLPVLYSAVPLGSQGRVVALGRDMRGLAHLQQRLVDAQNTLERDYWQLRNVELRYRLMFDLTVEAILIVDAASTKVVEANPAALSLLGLSLKRLVGQSFPIASLPSRAQRDLLALLGRVRASGHSEEASVRASATSRDDWVVSVSQFSQEDKSMFLVRLRPARPADAAQGPTGRQSIAQIIDRAPDGFVVTDPDGQVLMANAAFVDLVQLNAEEQLRGESLGRWLGRPGVDLSVMLATLRQQGTLRLFATTVHGSHGADAEVEISAVSVTDAEPPCLGFTVRHTGRRLSGEVQAGRSGPRSVDQLTQLVGRMPLKDLVRESTDLIEQLCIEAALQLTQGNRASAAEMLGLSRQSLYVKLRRYSMGDLGADGAA